MNEKTWTAAMSLLDEGLIDEALHYEKRRRPLWLRLGAAAACLTLVAALGLTLLPGGGAAVAAYARGTDEAITAAGAVMHSGTIRDSGEMTGHPLQFYLAGEDIESVRFSCEKQRMSFTDWTEARPGYGLVQNFTVPYGAEESEYRYLVIDWEPTALIRTLTDEADSTIASLPETLRSDRIIMEITFLDGSTAVKAIEVKLLENGSFFASFDDYTLTAEDAFVTCPDTESPSDGSLHDPADSPAGNGDCPLSDADLAAAEQSARDYYAGTVFTVEWLRWQEQTAEGIVLTARVSKGGVTQEPDRSITLRQENGCWIVVNEGY